MTARILTVDDSASIRATTKIVLTGAGFEVTEAVDGRDGLAKATSGTFDLIVTDLNMPNMNGIEMIKALRSLPQHTGTPIIFLTTESDGEIKSQAKAAGATGWITKPFDPDQMVKIARKVLGR